MRACLISGEIRVSHQSLLLQEVVGLLSLTSVLILQFLQPGQGQEGDKER